MNKESKLKQVQDYFSIQEIYYQYLHNKLGNKFIGESNKADGMIKEYSDKWQYLSTIEKESKLREIALECIKGNDVKINIRNGDSLMTAITNDSIFPQMGITGHINNLPYGKRWVGDKWDIWSCNEVTEVIKINK